MLWEYFLEKSLKVKNLYFDKKLLLNDTFFDSSARDWAPLHGKKNLFEQLIKAGANLQSSIKLISGIGFTETSQRPILWLERRVDEEGENEENPLLYFEKIIIQAY